MSRTFDIELYGANTYSPLIGKVYVMAEDSFEQFTLEWFVWVG